MKQKKIVKRVVILVVVCFIVLIGGIIGDILFSKSNLVEIKLDQIVEKMNNKDDFILILSQTTCSHCSEYKPRVENIANKYDIIVYYIEIDKLTAEEKKELKSYVSYADSTPTTVFIHNGYHETSANNIVGSGDSDEKLIYKFKSNGFID